MKTLIAIVLLVILFQTLGFQGAIIFLIAGTIAAIIVNFILRILKL